MLQTAKKKQLIIAKSVGSNMYQLSSVRLRDHKS